MFTMNVPKLQYIFSKRFKRVSKGTIDNTYNYFITSSSTLFHTIHNGHAATYCTSDMQDLTFNKRPISIKNVAMRQYNPRAQNCFHMSYPGIISQAILHNGRRCVGYKIGHDQCLHNIRHLSTGSTDSIAGTTVPLQYTGIFRTLSESVPVKIAQDSLLWMHDYTGLPWWSVIVLTTIVMRTTVTVPLSLYQHRILAKLENLRREMDQIVKELKIETHYGMQKYNWSVEYARPLYNRSARKQWNNLIIRENCHPAKVSILILAQIPLWVSLSVSIRNLCYMLPNRDASAYSIYQEFTSGGFLWITDLTVADPFVLPIAMGLFNLAIIEINYLHRLQEQLKWKKYLTYFFRIVTIGLIPIAMYVPSCVSLYWATSSAFGLFQNLLLLSPKLRRFAGVPITASESQNPYRTLRERIIARCRFRRRIDDSSKT